MKKTSYIRSYLMLALMFVISIAAWIGSFQIYQKKPGIADAGMYPLLMSTMMLISLVGALMETISKQKKEAAEAKAKGLEPERIEGSALLAALKEEFPLRTVFLGVCILGYAILFHFFGFYIPTAIFMLVTIIGLYHGKKILMPIGVTAVTLISVYLIIEKVFHIPLP